MTLLGKELIPIVLVTEERPLSPETPVTTPGRGKKKKKKTEGETEDEAQSPSEDVASPRGKGKKKKKKPATDGEVSRDVGKMQCERKKKQGKRIIVFVAELGL